VFWLIQLCESAEQPSKMHSGVLFLKDLLLVGGMIYEGVTVIMGHGTLGIKVEKIDSQVKTVDSQVKTLATELTDFKAETSIKLDKLLDQRWFLWR
jgi:outer membrane murein-binding lipoprotein Lpp